jgi:PIN domain nuclease of toxin-antitoxin system
VNLLLDTHALLWWLFDDPKFSSKARTAIEKSDRRVWVSSASAWEIATKVRIGKLPEIGDVAEKLPSYLRRERFEALPISLDHALAAGILPGPHKDPFDRMLIAQARIEKLRVVSIDSVFKQYGVPVLW